MSKNNIFREDTVLKVKTHDGRFVRRGHYGSTHWNPDNAVDPKDEHKIESIHNLKGLKSNITVRFKDYCDYEGNLDLNERNTKDFQEFLDEQIIEYELKEVNRMTMRQYLEKTGKLHRTGDE